MVDTLVNYLESINHVNIKYLQMIRMIISTSYQIPSMSVPLLKGKPFTGRYDSIGNKIFDEFIEGDYIIHLIIDEKSICTTNRFIANVLGTSEFVDSKIFPTFLSNRN